MVTSSNILALRYFVRMINPKKRKYSTSSGRKRYRPKMWNSLKDALKNKNFNDDWSTLDNSPIMRVFDRRQDERDSVAEHSRIKEAGIRFVIFECRDEVCTRRSNLWTPASPSVTQCLDKECREPKELCL